MKLLDLTLDDLASNLALDEALLEVAETATLPREVLRLWESPQQAVIVGRSSKVGEEVNWDACRRQGIPVLRRCSGGTSVLVGPGCLMYAVVLSYERRPQLRMIEEAHRFVLHRVAAAVNTLGAGRAKCRGTSDLVIEDRKISGNSLRCRRTHLLYHGTLLYDYPISLIEECLLSPPRQPEYRAGRSHSQFITNVPVAVDSLRAALTHAWSASEPLKDWPTDEMRDLVAGRYARDEWNWMR